MFVIGTAAAIVMALPTGGASTIAWISFAGTAVVTLMVSSTIYAVTYKVTTKIVSDMLDDTYYLPMYETTPYEIFSDKVLLFDINFFGNTPPQENSEDKEESIPINYGNREGIGSTYAYKLNQEEYDKFKKEYGFEDNSNITNKNEKKFKTAPGGSPPTIMYEYKWKYNNNEYKVYYAYGGWKVGVGETYYIVDLCKKTSESKSVISTAMELQKTIASWYLTFRNIALVALLSILVYVGIRITLSSVASDKAKYKQMLLDWLVALCLVFLMHYIMSFSVSIVKKITDMLTSIQSSEESTEELKKQLEKVNPQAAKNFRDAMELFVITSEKNDGTEDEKVKNAYRVLVEEHEDENNQYKNYFFTDTTLTKNATKKEDAKVLVWPANNSMEQARMRLQFKGKDGNTRPIMYGYAIIYVVLILYTVIFSFTYLKRVIYMAFLTIIAPLVAVTYPIDKMNDGKAQAFDMWLKEYIFNLLIQPLHLVLYIILINSAMTFATKNVFYVVLALGFFVPAEKLLRRFFGFEKAQTPGMFAGPAGSAVMMAGLNKLMHPKPPKDRLGVRSSSKDEGENVDNQPPWKVKEFDPIEKIMDKDNNKSEENFIDNKLEYDKNLSKSQVDELKAEGIQPGDQEYRQYLINRGINSNNKPGLNNNETDKIQDIARGKKDISIGKNGMNIPNINKMYKASNIDKPKRKRSIKRALGRATRNYGSGMKKKLQQRYKAKGGMGRRAIRMAAGIYGATTLAAAGGIVGITSGDPTKAIQYMSAGTVGGYTLGKRVANNTIDSLRVEGTLKEAKKGYYGDDYSKIEQEKYKEDFFKNEKNINKIQDKLKVERKEAKRIMEQNMGYYLDNDIYSIDDLVATYRLEKEEKMSRDKAVATARVANQVMDGEDVNKMTKKRKKEYKDILVPRFTKLGSKNPEEDVEKVFDNVSRFQLFKNE